MNKLPVTTKKDEIDDYELMEKDFKEWWRRGLIEFGMDPSIADQWDDEERRPA